MDDVYKEILYAIRSLSKREVMKFVSND